MSDQPRNPEQISLPVAAGSVIAMGRATHVGEDADGNPVYDVDAASIFRVTDRVIQRNVVPFRPTMGVRHVPLPVQPVKCMGFKSPVDHEWTWLIQDAVDWGEC